MSIAEKLQTIAENQQNVYNAGYEKGKAEADTETAYNNGFKDGKKAEYDKFWDIYQQNGKLEDYQFSFAGVGWNRENFKPKYDIIPTNLNTSFFNFNRFGTDWETFDMVAHLNALGVVLDTSKCSNMTSTFMWIGVCRLGVIDCTASSKLTQTFYGSKIRTIDKLILKQENTFNNIFHYNSELTNITIEGVIGNDISFKDSNLLTHDSLMSIINHLGSVTTTKILTLHADSKSKLTDAEKAIATQKGWTIA